MMPGRTRYTIDDIQRRWSAADARDERRTAPTTVVDPVTANILAVVSRNGEGCLTHLVRYVVNFSPTYRPPHSSIQAQCGQTLRRGEVDVIDPAAEMFACARCIATADRYGEPSFNLVPSTGCEQSQGRRRGRPKMPRLTPPADGTIIDTTTNTERGAR